MIKDWFVDLGDGVEDRILWMDEPDDMKGRILKIVKGKS